MPYKKHHQHWIDSDTTVPSSKFPAIITSRSGAPQSSECSNSRTKLVPEYP
ncbi:hypothetical protein H206_06172 [Candidatus Electrothrix aarhusensis]|uniref:Uncharacterized protein n=1 Tax=Candidatus Electrothrix aarhusensis TaxID=1859131 RepID=A0A3S4TCH4_9BACT|nr:hypothetical protein H206_06172 [Candidatus Electrothrix aarhusensis]